jgi:putative OPT family oligopeptide transporter
MQIIGVAVAAFALAPILNVLNGAYTIGSAKLPAPQANLMRDVATAVFEHGLPWRVACIGAVLAALVIAIDVVLKKRKSAVRAPVMAFAVGMYLPFGVTAAIFLGGLVAHIVSRRLEPGESAQAHQTEWRGRAMLLPAGLITGEALMGITLALALAAWKDADALALFGGQWSRQRWPAVMIAATTLILIYRAATRSPSARPS